MNIVIEEGGERRIKAVQSLRKLLSSPNPPIDNIIGIMMHCDVILHVSSGTGVVPYLVKYINREEPERLQVLYKATVVRIIIRGIDYYYIL